jgi:ParB-like chromosome segregation protein Spo0J
MASDVSTQEWAANQVQMMPISSLNAYDDNPRIHGEDQIDAIKKAINEWGWTIPILVDEKNMVIAGHGRLMAAEDLGIDQVPCMVAKGWTDEQKRAYVIADNKIQEKGQWDNGAVFRQLRELAQDEFDVSLIDFDLDLSSLTYAPVLEPVAQPASSFADVTASDFTRAEAKLDQQNQNMVKQEKGLEVVCPFCTETFTFHGS